MREACFCGHAGEVEDREPVVTEDGRPALRCPDEACRHLEYLGWLPEDAKRSVFEEAARRRECRERPPAA